MEKMVIADKIASVAQHLALKRELWVSTDIPCEEGVLVAVEILNNKATYNKLELTSGRMAQVKRGWTCAAGRTCRRRASWTRRRSS